MPLHYKEILHLHSLCFPIPHPPHSPLIQTYMMHFTQQSNKQSKIQFLIIMQIRTLMCTQKGEQTSTRDIQFIDVQTICQCTQLLTHYFPCRDINNPTTIYKIPALVSLDFLLPAVQVLIISPSFFFALTGKCQT